MTAPLTLDDLRLLAADVLGVSPGELDESENLIGRGFDSLRLMRMATRLRGHGIDIGFGTLAEAPTLRAWADLLGGPAPEPAAAPALAEPFLDPGEPFDLGLMQHAYWLGREAGQQLGGVAAHIYSELDGAGVDPDRLERAIRTLTGRHEMLRVRFRADGRQEILPESPWPGLIVNDLSALPQAEVERRLDALRQELSHQVLDLAAGQVFDIRLSLLPGGRTRLHYDVDMAIGDAVSNRIVLADLVTLYEDPTAELPAIGYSYRRYLTDRPRSRAAQREDSARWWRERLTDLPGSPVLPVGSAQQQQTARRSRRLHFWLPPERLRSLTAEAGEHGLTPAMALTGAFALTLAQWSGEPRFLLNMPMFDRDPLHPDVAHLVGDFSSSVLLAVDAGVDRPFREACLRLQAELHTNAAHTDYSGLEVLRDLGRATGGQVVAPIVVTSALNLGELFGERVERLFGLPVWVMSQGPQVLLDVQFTEERGGLLVNWDLREDAFLGTAMVDMFDRFQEVVERLTTRSLDWAAPLPSALPPEQAAVRARVNDTAGPVPEGLLHEAFFTRAATEPETVALLWPGGSWTYGELADRALRVGAELRARGLRPGGTVAVRLPKGPEQVVAALGVLAAGGTYLPVGTDQPAARQASVLRLGGARLMVVADVGEPLAGVEQIPVGEALAAEPLPEPRDVDPETPAYVLFTSGSTGTPKGVEVPHRAALNTVTDLDRRFALGPADRTLTLSRLEFDLSVFDLFGPLSAGGAVVVVGEQDARDAESWVRMVRELGVTVLNCVPTLLDMLLTAAAGRDLGAVRLVLLGGDWVDAALAGRLRAVAPAARFVGLGGTTETAIHSTLCEVVGEPPEEWRTIPYGTPLAGVVCRVVDARGHDCPDLVTGELWIGGAGVARGYRGDPARTAAAFVEHEGTRWYRTGDLARYRPDGSLEFLGRRDHQVKVRGHRIELGEVEAALRDVPGVDAAVALLIGERPALRIVAAAAGSPDLDAEALVAAVADRVPAYMVPDPVLVLGTIPTTPNGKIDRAALVRLFDASSELTVHVPPANDLEYTVASVMAEVLEIERISADQDFLAAGGDSVQVTAVVAGLREALDSALPTVSAVFSGRTPTGVAAALVAAEAAEDRPGRLLAAAEIYREIAEMTDDEVRAATAGEPAGS